MQLRRIGIASAATVARTEDFPPWFGPLFGPRRRVIFPILCGIMGVIFGAAVAAIYKRRGREGGRPAGRAG